MDEVEIFDARFRIDNRFRTPVWPERRRLAHRILLTGFETLLSPENCTLDILAVILEYQLTQLRQWPEVAVEATTCQKSLNSPEIRQCRAIWGGWSSKGPGARRW
jgi:hypothetical protein